MRFGNNHLIDKFNSSDSYLEHTGLGNDSVEVAMKKLILPIIGTLLLHPFTVAANTLSFAEIWRKVSESSPAQEGARLRTQSVEESLSRAKNHWLPKVYLDARSYRTNDPGNSFFGLLEQRKVETTDFSPNPLNHPNSQTFTRGALGLNLAFYEGGMKQAQTEMFRHQVASQKLLASQIELEQYAQSGFAYGMIASRQTQKAKFKELSGEISKLMKRYQLGQKSNPVGYSGLLGMKSLANRIAGLVEQLEAQENASYGVLKEMGIKEVNWIPQSFDARAFVDQYLSTPQSLQESRSYKTLAEIEETQAANQASTMEKARYLPRAGAFAEAYLFNGSRATSNGYTAGLYLQWNLFDPSDFGRYKEAKLQAMAADQFTQASIQRENAEQKNLLETIRALRSNLARLDESDKLLSEQTRVSSTLFKNGSINALQFVEILNRRTDLISLQSEAEMSLLKTATEQIKKYKFEVPKSVSEGAQK